MAGRQARPAVSRDPEGILRRAVERRIPYHPTPIFKPIGAYLAGEYWCARYTFMPRMR